MRGLFVDRDGVINRNRSDYVRCLDQFQFLPGTLDALARAAHSPFTIVVVTNQSAVGRGLMSRDTLDAMHQEMQARVRAHGGRIDGIYVCPHRPSDACSCRKPQPGMLRRAARDLALDLAGSYFIGDSSTDVHAALAAGCRPVLVLSGLGQEAHRELIGRGVDPGAYDVVPDLQAAVESLTGVALMRRDAWAPIRIGAPVAAG